MNSLDNYELGYIQQLVVQNDIKLDEGLITVKEHDAIKDVLTGILTHLKDRRLNKVDPSSVGGCR